MTDSSAPWGQQYPISEELRARVELEFERAGASNSSVAADDLIGEIQYFFSAVDAGALSTSAKKMREYRSDLAEVLRKAAHLTAFMPPDMTALLPERLQMSASILRSLADDFTAWEKQLVKQRHAKNGIARRWLTLATLVWQRHTDQWPARTVDPDSDELKHPFYKILRALFNAAGPRERPMPNVSKELLLQCLDDAQQVELLQSPQGAKKARTKRKSTP